MTLFTKTYQDLRWRTFSKLFQLPIISTNELGIGNDTFLPPILEKIYMPPYYGPKDHDDVSPLLHLVKTRLPKVVLELGTAYGTTAANICAISDARVFTVNALPEQISGDVISSVLTKEEIGCVYRTHGFEKRVTQIYENTINLDVTHYLPLKSVDLAIIDACHDADFVIGDFLRILPALHSNSVVFFHDVHPSMKEHLVQSYVAGMYLRKLGYNIKHLENTWWAVWNASDPNVPKTGMLWIDRLLKKILELKMGSLDSVQDATYLGWVATLHQRNLNKKKK